MINAEIKATYETIRSRVTDVARLQTRCALLEGAGRLVWQLGAPLLIVVLAQAAIGLPFWLRVPVLPLLLAGLIIWGWRWIVQPSREHYTPTRAALLVESKRPELRSRIVSALETYSDLESPHPRFDSDMVRALILHAHESTRLDDFRDIIDRKPTRRQLTFATLTLILWAAAYAFNPTAIGASLSSLVTAWSDLRDLAQKAAGAKISVDRLDKAAYLVGSDISIRAHQHGFHNSEMTILIREKDAEWKSAVVSVTESGDATFVVHEAKKSFEFYFTSGKIESEIVKANVTEQPRIVNITVEYEMPEYVRRGTVVQPRSDGNLKALYGSTIIVTLEANKPLKSVTMAGSFLKQSATPMQVAGTFAKSVIRLEGDQWLSSTQTEIKESYTLHMTDEYGYTNADAERAYDLIIMKDQPPKAAFIGLPHRSSADEIHVLEQNLGSIPVAIKASDDYGIARVTLKYRIEDLITGAEKKKDQKEIQFAMPRAEIPQLPMLRLTEIGAAVGDRIVLSAEVGDAYNLDPQKGPHKTSTPVYRIAVVTQEELFNEAVYKDDWSTQWYESLQVATLSKREVPPRGSPESEPASKVAAKLLEASQAGDGVKGSDLQLMQDYFDSLNVIKTSPIEGDKK